MRYTDVPTSPSTAPGDEHQLAAVPPTRLLGTADFVPFTGRCVGYGGSRASSVDLGRGRRGAAERSAATAQV